MEHVLLPWLEFVPMGQDEHADTPSVSEYLFASQLMQDAVPAPALYFPAAQGVHGGPPSVPENPETQRHLDIPTDPGGKYRNILFIGQSSVHMLRFVAPVATENIPGGHSVQKEEPVMSWYEPTAQEVHVLRPDVDEIVPVSHCMQVIKPVVFENSPGGHSLQTDDPVIS
jgi:hypothetical protein